MDIRFYISARKRTHRSENNVGSGTNLFDCKDRLNMLNERRKRGHLVNWGSLGKWPLKLCLCECLCAWTTRWRRLVKCCVTMEADGTNCRREAATLCPPQGRQAAALSGRWRRLCCRPYKLHVSSDLNRQRKRPDDLDLWPFDLKSGIRVTCDVTYLCAKFSLPRPVCSWLRPNVRGRLTDRCQTSDNIIA